MVFIYFADEDGVEYGVPLDSIVELKLTPADKETEEEAEFQLETKSEETYTVAGKAGQKAWDEIKIQIKEHLKIYYGLKPVTINPTP
jgi:hypothetical protein